MKRKYLLEEWNNFAQMAIPPDMSPDVRAAARRIFMSGAVAIWSLIMNKLDASGEPTDKDLTLMDTLQKELDDFAREARAQAKGGPPS